MGARPVRRCLAPGLVAGALTALAFLAAPVGVLAPNGATVLLALAALAALIAVPPRTLAAGAPRAVAVALFGLLALGLLSALWSLDPAKSLYKAGQMALLFALGLALWGAARTMPSDRRQGVGQALAAGLVVALALLVFEYATQGMIYHLVHPDAASFPLQAYNRGATVAAILLWPAAYAVHGRFGRLAAAVLILAVLAVVANFKSDAATLAVVLGLAVGAAAATWPRVAPAALAACVAAIVLFAPLAPGAIRAVPGVTEFLRAAAPSAYHRVMIWEFARDRIAERPLLGWGLDAARALPGGHADADGQGEILPLHPHSAALQWRVELGLPAALLGAFLFAWPVARLPRHLPDRWVLAAASAAAVSMACVALLSYGIWQSWWIAVLWIAASLSAAVLRGIRPA
ncbi:MAG: O-antigen ligase family protein [Pseudomonadota bacterium]